MTTSGKIKCVIVDDERIAREILQQHLANVPFVEVVASCKNAMETLDVLRSNPVDVIFLDINMPGLSGLSLAKSIQNNVKVIFTTAYREYAVEGFDLQAVDYLLKPISFERLLQALNKYNAENPTVKNENSEEIASADIADFVFVRADRKMVKVRFDEILYVESLGDYLKIYLDHKTVITRENISGFEAKLPPEWFLRTHRSFLVALRKIDSFTNEYVEIGEKYVPISRSYKQSVLEKLESKR